VELNWTATGATASSDRKSTIDGTELTWHAVDTVNYNVNLFHFARAQGKKTSDVLYVFYESPGTDHEWQTWRRDLKDFAPRLFQ
jgi:enterochelin esterase-like enzyme